MPTDQSRRADAQAYEAAIDAAIAKRTAPAVRTSGCGRAYVRFFNLTRAQRTALRKRCEVEGWRWLGADSGRNKDSIYVGYDNADGIALGQAQAMTGAFKAHGYECCHDGEDD